MESYSKLTRQTHSLVTRMVLGLSPSSTPSQLNALGHAIFLCCILVSRKVRRMMLASEKC